MKIPYELRAAMSPRERWMQMYHALNLRLPKLEDQAIDETRRLSIACYGPSLRETWRDLERPILTVSGALKFLVERGVVPDYHVDMDPRPNKAFDVLIDGWAPEAVHYLMASCCPPGTWVALRGRKVSLWHADCGDGTLDFLSQYDPGAKMVQGGSHVGLSALHVGGKLGFRHFEIHGMDCSFAADGARHAGPHSGHTQKDDTTWDAGGVTYRTSQIMANGAAEAVNTFRLYPIFGVFHGHGLTQALIREEGIERACCADDARAAQVRAMRATVFRTLWQQLRARRTPEVEVQTAAMKEAAEARRARASYNTGSISLEAMLLLRGLVEQAKSKVVVEIGTFIGASTTAIASEADHVFTCDRSNDCLDRTAKITPYPKTESTAMLLDLAQRGVRADFFFIDGRVQPQDVPLILRVSKPETIYCFDDYEGSEKGVANVNLLGPFLPEHGFVGPETSECSLAVLVHAPHAKVGTAAEPAVPPMAEVL